MFTYCAYSYSIMSIVSAVIVSDRSYITTIDRDFTAIIPAADADSSHILWCGFSSFGIYYSTVNSNGLAVAGAVTVPVSADACCTGAAPPGRIPMPIPIRMF